MNKDDNEQRESKHTKTVKSISESKNEMIWKKARKAKKL